MSMPAWEKVGSFSEAQLKETLVWLKTVPQGRGQAQLGQMLFFRWGEIDPVTAMAIARENPVIARDCEAEKAILSAWAKQDLDAARQWAEKNASEEACKELNRGASR
ncbi:MAG: hypothetical protein QM755_10490 [Luteolibacter sp.]